MKIAMIAPVWDSVPAEKYGGIERIIYHLTEGLVRRGHQVTLFASGDSITSGKLVSVISKHVKVYPNLKIDDTNEYNILNFGLAYSRHGEFDIIHDHNGPMSLPAANICKTPVLYTLHYIYDNHAILWRSMTNPYLIAISKGQLKKEWGIRPYKTIYHGLNMTHYPFGKNNKDYLLFVGRMHPDKGLHIAIEVAQRLNKKLKIVTRYLDYIDSQKEYFEKMVKPSLGDPRIEMIGEVDEGVRNNLMSKALCLLHPITWPEPFGLAMIEAMACGCPVVAFNDGSVPEIVQNGQTGFVVENADEMVEAVKRIDEIDRQVCRNFSINFFNLEKMINSYERTYADIITAKKARRGKDPAISRSQLALLETDDEDLLRSY